MEMENPDPDFPPLLRFAAGVESPEPPYPLVAMMIVLSLIAPLCARFPDSPEALISQHPTANPGKNTTPMPD